MSSIIPDRFPTTFCTLVKGAEMLLIPRTKTLNWTVVVKSARIFYSLTSGHSFMHNLWISFLHVHYNRHTCICTDWQLTNSTLDTTLSKTTAVFLQESRKIELILPLTVMVDSEQRNAYTTLFISAPSTTSPWFPFWYSYKNSIIFSIRMGEISSSFCEKTTETIILSTKLSSI